MSWNERLHPRNHGRFAHVAGVGRIEVADGNGGATQAGIPDRIRKLAGKNAEIHALDGANGNPSVDDYLNHCFQFAKGRKVGYVAVAGSASGSPYIGAGDAHTEVTAYSTPKAALAGLPEHEAGAIVAVDLKGTNARRSGGHSVVSGLTMSRHAKIHGTGGGHPFGVTEALYRDKGRTFVHVTN